MAIYYIDLDDEITSAAARIRDSADTRIALVIQSGSRVATSRINFRLLAGEARHRGRRLAIIASDPSVRSLAQTAGLPVFAAVSDYQRAEAARPPGTQPGGADAVGDALDELAATVDVGGANGPVRVASGSARRVGETGQPGGRARPAGRSSGHPYRLLALAFAALLVVGGIGAWVLLPSATVVLTVKSEPVGPLNVMVKVDPEITTPNDSTLTVPGVAQEFPIQASGTFNATGQNVVDTPATGTVTFTSWNTGSAVTIPSGTQIETASKVAFATTAAVTVPKARVTVSGTVIATAADAPVTAVKKGPGGNVAAGAIVNVPGWLATALVVTDQVTNHQATSGGTHVVTPFVQQADIDAAQASLTGQLGTSFQASVADPSAVASGMELFPKTAQLGPPSFSPDASTLLNAGQSTFDLAATATGTATAADLGNVRNLAERKVRSMVEASHTLVDGSVDVSLGSATNVGSVLDVPVVATASQAATLDISTLRDAIKGMSVAEAKEYLSRYGTADVSTSPFWVSTIPGFDFRIDIRVVAPAAQPTGAVPKATPRLPGRTPTPTSAATSTATSTAPSISATPTSAASPTGGGASPTATSNPAASPTASPRPPTPTPSPTAPSQPSPTATP